MKTSKLSFLGCVLLLLNLNLFLTPIYTTPPANAAISGAVSDENGNPLANIQVYLARQIDYPTGKIWTSFLSGETDVAGAYNLVNLDANTYRICFSENANPKHYNTACYDNASTLETATDVVVGYGEAVSGINVHLTPTSRLAGIVTDLSGNPLHEILVLTYYLSGESAWHPGNSAVTDANGQYEVIGLEQGLYRIEFSDHQSPAHYVTEYYDNAPDLDSATTVAINAGAVIDAINVQLAEPSQVDPGDRITGTVSDEAGSPLAGIEVDLFQFESDGNYWSTVQSTLTDDDGFYELGNLAAGAYHVGFADTAAPQVYMPELFDDASDLESATDIVVAFNEEVTNIDAQLQPVGQVAR